MTPTAPPFDDRPQYDAAPTIPGLAYIWLEETGIVGVEIESHEVRLICQAHVLPGHAEHRPHGPELWGDYRWAELIIDRPEEILIDHPVGLVDHPDSQEHSEIYVLKHDGDWIELGDGNRSIRWRGGTARFELWPPDASPPGSG